MKNAPKPKRPYLWQDLSVDEIRALMKSGCRTALVPVAVTEQHGYHLTTFTDCRLAWELSVRAAAKADCFVVPLLPYAFSGGTLPGTINIQPETVALIVADIADSLFAQGIMNVVVVLGHGGNENFWAIQNMKHLYFHKRPHLADRLLAVVPVWECSPTWMEITRKDLHRGDFHAGDTETSLIMHLAPGDVRRSKMTTDVPRLLAAMRRDPNHYQLVEKVFDHPFVAPHVSQRPEIKVGVMGDPFAATEELGRKLSDEIAAGLASFVRDVSRRRPGRTAASAERRTIDSITG